MKYTITIDTATVALASPYFQREIPRLLKNITQIMTSADFELRFREEWILRDLNGAVVGNITYEDKEPQS
jgi:hypothetical protein